MALTIDPSAGKTINDKAQLKQFFELVIGSCERQLGGRKVITSAFLDALNSFQALRDEAPGIAHYSDEQLSKFAAPIFKPLIEAVETLQAQGLAILDRLNSLEQDSEKDAAVYLEREDLKLRTRKRVKVISAGRITLNKELLAELNVGEGDVADVYRYNVDGEFPKLLVEFVTWRAPAAGQPHPKSCSCGSCQIAREDKLSPKFLKKMAKADPL